MCGKEDLPQRAQIKIKNETEECAELEISYLGFSQRFAK